MIIDFGNPVPPPEYKCDCCGTIGVRLWHQMKKTDTGLICQACLEKKTDERTPSRRGEVYGFETEFGLSVFLMAIPSNVDGNDFWSLEEAPRFALAWWYTLPERKELNVDELKSTLIKLLSLVEEPQTGLASWNILFQERLVELNRMIAPFCKKAGGK